MGGGGVGVLAVGSRLSFTHYTEKCLSRSGARLRSRFDREWVKQDFDVFLTCIFICKTPIGGRIDFQLWLISWMRHQLMLLLVVWVIFVESHNAWISTRIFTTLTQLISKMMLQSQNKSYPTVKNSIYLFNPICKWLTKSSRFDSRCIICKVLLILSKSVRSLTWKCATTYLAQTYQYKNMPMVYHSFLKRRDGAVNRMFDFQP